jgi:dolichol-phosphate mannosyltransferase
VNILVIVPTYNERENLPQLVPAVLARAQYRLMIVDDGSPDGTGQVAEELSRQWPGRLEVVHRQGARGLGRSYVEGMQRALAAGTAEVICQMDADLSHNPEHLPALVAATEAHDLVIGSRYLNGISVVNWPLRRIVLSTMANGYIRAVTGLSAHDCTSGFRAWRREALARIPLAEVISDGYAFLVETLYEAARRGCRIGEVPIIFIERREGQSKLSKRVLMESLVAPWRLRLRSLPGTSPRATV